MRAMVLLDAPSPFERSVRVDVEGAHHPVGAVEPDGDHAAIVDQRWIGDEPVGSTTDLGEADRSALEIHPHEMQRRRGDPTAAERAGVPLATGTVVEEPGRTECTHRIPTVGLSLQ